jgi:hypothetical protein
MLSLVIPASGVVRSAAAVGEDPSLVGKWSAPFDVGLVAIHSVLLRTGKVLLFEKPSGSTRGSRGRVFDPQSGFLPGPPPSATVRSADVPDPTDIYCAASSLLSDGRVFVVGGHGYGRPTEYGIPDTTVFDPTGGWTKGPVMPDPRWYATTVEQANGKVLIFSGTSRPGVHVNSVDRYNPASRTLTKLPASADLKMALYPRMFLRPDGTLIRVGPEPATEVFDPSSATWSQPTSSGVSRSGGMTVMLPGLNKILAAGGGAPAVASAQILDLSGPTPRWRPTTSMNAARRWANGVVLPDGTVLAVGGGADARYTGPVFSSELFDPVSETWTTVAAQRASRMYHSTALLLPDGRVLSAGQTNGTLQKTAEVYSPPYLFHGRRPKIGSAPSILDYGARFAISTRDAADVSRVALIRPGSVTHSVSFDQRYLRIPFRKAQGSLIAKAPANGNVAPPGWYMLFLLNSAGVPSVASWVHLGGR